MKFLAILLVTLIALSRSFAASDSEERKVSVSIISDQAEAVLRLLQKRADKEEIADSDWNRIFASEGYRRLKKREQSMSRPFEEAEFQRFVMSDDLLARREQLVETLRRWQAIDPSAAGDKALLYLPRRARITAKIYPVIKPRDNSFVFEVKTDPAIFLYLDPKVSPEKFENTLTHELHHIGFGTACPSPDNETESHGSTTGVRSARAWIGAFGEGLAMLAAAGAYNIHPHIASDPTERADWDASMVSFDSDLKNVEAFLRDVATGRLSGDAENKAGFAFFGVQGPWYTVGWKMASIIEKEYGRDKLIDVSCDRRRLLKTYNSAARKYEAKHDEKLAVWSEDLLDLLN